MRREEPGPSVHAGPGVVSSGLSSQAATSSNEFVAAEEGLRTETSIAKFVFFKFCTTLMLFNKFRLQ